MFSCMTTARENPSMANTGRSARTAAVAHRSDLLEESDRYLAELVEEVGEPSQQEVAEAEEWCDRIVRHLKRAPGTR